MLSAEIQKTYRATQIQPSESLKTVQWNLLEAELGAMTRETNVSMSSAAETLLFFKVELSFKKSHYAGFVDIF